MPQLFSPFTRLIDTLLPHLRWRGVDDSNDNDIRCLFSLKDRPGLEFDIDALSSGEKAVIALLLPFVERQAEQLITPATVAPGVVPITMILDEPEIHLHPSLQLQVLQYLRDLGKEGAAQFILSTHSTTLLDAFTDEELWLLSPASINPENQLTRLSTDFERLEVARSITGSTHLLTRAAPIVIMEGVPSKASAAGDARLTKLMLPSVRHWSLVPSGGKSEVQRAVKRLRASEIDVPGLPVFGLIDGDHGSSPEDDHVIEWPVAMIENLLLDGAAIIAALEALPLGTQGRTAQSIDAEILAIASSRRDDEIALRMRADLPVGYLRFDATGDGELERVAAEQSAAWVAAVSARNPTALRAEAEVEVDAIIGQGKQTEKFHGKDMFKKLCDTLPLGALSVGAFAALVASNAGTSERLDRLASPAIQRIRLYVPDASGHVTSSHPPTDLEPERAALSAMLAEARVQWEGGSPEARGRVELRERMFAYARQLLHAERIAIGALASEIGTL